ncbi:DUF2000 domain-containing protein [Microbacterium sp. W4I20]|uniref:DUF2000 domain-containing protein n=1 Tax=Microbacterium sp. W4I20 TaxID=3042262 RepID=UPI0027836748|nr:DUF2000 domain-containing protein [Microbacterium sp. W4I20]MDQ0727644.1 hypothetical protein [Microbacterium sp. W4I20]
MTESTTPFRFDTRAVVIVRDDLETWQKLNVTAFLSTGIAADASLLGEVYRDADDTEYTPMLREPIIVRVARAAELTAIRTAAVNRGLRTAIYTAELFATTHDEANRAAVASVPGDALDLVGLAVHGAKNVVDRITKRAVLHP